jgi:hypothetical protein
VKFSEIVRNRDYIRGYYLGYFGIQRIEIDSPDFRLGKADGNYDFHSKGLDRSCPYRGDALELANRDQDGLIMGRIQLTSELINGYIQQIYFESSVDDPVPEMKFRWRSERFTSSGMARGWEPIF